MILKTVKAVMVGEISCHRLKELYSANKSDLIYVTSQILNEIDNNAFSFETYENSDFSNEIKIEPHFKGKETYYFFTITTPYIQQLDEDGEIITGFPNFPAFMYREIEEFLTLKFNVKSLKPKLSQNQIVEEIEWAIKQAVRDYENGETTEERMEANAVVAALVKVLANVLGQSTTTTSNYLWEKYKIDIF